MLSGLCCAVYLRWAAGSAIMPWIDRQIENADVFTGSRSRAIPRGAKSLLPPVPPKRIFHAFGEGF